MPDADDRNHVDFIGHGVQDSVVADSNPMNLFFPSKGSGTWGPWIDRQQVDRGSDALLVAALQTS